jgi:hypothetical protein
MYETIEYPYSKNSAMLGMLLPLVFFTITFNNLKAAWTGGYILVLAIIGIADLVFLSFLVFVLVKRLLPAVQNRVALELSEEGISDYQRNIVIEWKDVEGISQEFGRSFSKLIIDLKYETDYGSQIAISLRWVAGKDAEICETAMAYFEEMKRLS